MIMRTLIPTSKRLFAVGLCSIGLMLALYSFATPVPDSGELTPSNTSITYTDGPLVTNATHLVLGTPDCTAPNSCSDFTLTVSANSLVTTHNVRWEVQWPLVNADVDIFLFNSSNQLIAANISYTDPAILEFPIPADGTSYHLVAVNSGGTTTFTGTASLVPKYPTAGQGPGVPPRYLNYAAANGQADASGEPSIGVDWNPNVPALQHEKVNTGGVAFYTAIDQEYRVNFDDCSSPAVNLWEDTVSPIVTGLDPIGFVDHFTSAQLGTSYPPPQTPGRAFHLELAAGSSTAAMTDNDGGSWTSFVAGSPPAGIDHETLGGGPFHAPMITPPPPAYPNAIYYCSQFGVEQASCSRSDDGGLTFGPAVPIFPSAECAGGIHGHVRVSPQGTVYVPNSSCAEGSGQQLGVNGVALSRDNGITWDDVVVPASTGFSDPSLGIGQNSVGKPAGQTVNTIYLGWVAADGHAHIAHSPDEGTTWANDIDVSSIFGIEKAVFPAVVAGDDNRAAFAFLGTDPAFYPARQVWHLYVATTYDGGNTWILIDATPFDPVQIGEICLLGAGCSGSRNLLDFIGIDIDAEGRVLVGYADGCLNCSNNQTTQSTAAKGTIARQSGGRRLFSQFDPQVEPSVPAAPQVLSAVRVTDPVPGVKISWLKPDNGGSTITRYNIYRSDTSGNETFYAFVSGADVNVYLDTNAPATSNWFYRVTAVNAVGEGLYCREVNVNSVPPVQTACAYPYLTLVTDPTGDQVGGPTANTQEDIQRVSIGEPFTTCSDKSITFIEKVQTLSPAVPPGGAWRVIFQVRDNSNTLRTVYVQMETQTRPAPMFNYGFVDSNGLRVNQCGRINGPSPCPITGSYLPDGTIVMKLDTSAPLKFFATTNVGTTPDFTVSFPQGALLANIMGSAQLGAIDPVDSSTTANYLIATNLACAAQLPSAVLMATPLSGPAPLMVNFNASQSHTNNPCAAIVSYTLDFGDGSPAVTQSSPLFSHTYSTPGSYGAQLKVTDAAGQMSTNPAQVVITVTPSAPQLGTVESRKTHGAAGTFDINLPLSGNPGVECRTGGANGDHTLVFTFDGDISSIGGVTVTSINGMATADTPIITGGVVTVNLHHVANAQKLIVTLASINAPGNNASVTMGVLLGDATGNGSVNASDISLTKSHSGQGAIGSNFRADINANGLINSSDISQVKSKSGTALP